MFSTYDEISDCAAPPRTLCDWVRNFRIKKMRMKRKLRTGGDLRVCAIMATALHSAENRLRLKQQERLHRCLRFQSKFNEKLSYNNAEGKGVCIDNDNDGGVNAMPLVTHITSSAVDYYKEIVEQKENDKRRIEICNLWREELNGLDEFMRKMSSSNCYCSIDNETCSGSAYRSETNNCIQQRHSIAVSS